MIQDFYSKLSEQERKVFYVTIGIVVFSMFDFLFFRPVSVKLKSIDQDVESIRNDIKRDVRFLAHQDQIFAEDRALSAFQIDQQKSEEEIIAAFLKTIELLASEAKINLSTLSPAEAEVKKGYALYYAGLECSGRFEDMVTFMHKISTTKNLLKIVKVNLAGKKASADEVMVTMKVAKLIMDPKVMEGAAHVMEKGHIEGPDVFSSDVIRSPGSGANDGDGGGETSGGGSSQKSDYEGAPGPGGTGGSGMPSQPGNQVIVPGLGMSRASGGGSTAGEPDPNQKESGNEERSHVHEKLGMEEAERIQVKDFSTAWRDFWGIKPKKKPAVAEADAGDSSQENSEAGGEEEQGSVWQRKFEKKKDPEQ